MIMEPKKDYKPQKPQALVICDAVFEKTRVLGLYLFLIGIPCSVALYFWGAQPLHFLWSVTITILGAFVYICISTLKNAHKLAFSGAVEAYTRPKMAQKAPKETRTKKKASADGDLASAK